MVERFDGPGRESTQILRNPFAAAARAPRVPTLVVLRGHEAGRLVKITAEGLILGRSAEADLTVEDEGASRRHCRVALGPDQRVSVTDLGSTNGTFVNNQKVTSCILSEGDQLMLGNAMVLTLRQHDPLEEGFQRRQYELATRDGLTGCFNKTFLMEQLTTDIAFCQRHQLQLSVAIADLDHFKQVNDTYGHLVGDAILRAVGRALLDLVRKSDLVARFGGEEFVIVMRQTPLDGALVLAEKIRESVGALQVQAGSRTVAATCSIGVACLATGGGATELLATADACLYRAKGGGRNRVVGP